MPRNSCSTIRFTQGKLACLLAGYFSTSIVFKASLLGGFLLPKFFLVR